MSKPTTDRLAEELADALGVPHIHDLLEADEGKWDRLIKALTADMPSKNVLTLEQEVRLQNKVQAALASNPAAGDALMKLLNWNSLRESLTMEAAYAVGLAVGRRNGCAR